MDKKQSDYVVQFENEEKDEGCCSEISVKKDPISNIGIGDIPQVLSREVPLKTECHDEGMRLSQYG